VRTAFTLPELVLVLVLMGIAGTALLPGARAAADRLAVISAREAVAGLVAQTRTQAMLHGGAVLRLRAADGRGWIEAGDATVAEQRLGEEFGVEVELGATGEAELVFDALGLGRRASRTVVLRRGRAEARIVVAAYGRALRS
jgi:prepilin-type N-terminal cleavage/methylation domain-containing protein